MWPDTLRDEILRLGEEQYYSILWETILRIYLPQKFGFSFEHSPRQASAECIVVKHYTRPLLVITWQIPYKSRPHIPEAVELPRSLRFTDHTVLQLQNCGLIVSYHEVHTVSWDSTRAHPHNALYGVHEPNGAALVQECFADVFREARVHREFDISHDEIMAVLRRLPDRELCTSRPLVGFMTCMEVAKHPQDANIACSADQFSHIIAFKQSFPTDIASIIVSFLDANSLRSFSCVSSRCNDIADRRLWSNFVISSRDDADTEELEARMYAVIRNPRRAQFIRSLVVGPCGWRWTAPLITSLHEAMKTACGVSSLTLLHSRVFPRKWGNEFSPVIRMLACMGSQLRLRSFEFNDWLDTSTPLVDFLATQPQLEQLVGLDVEPERTLHCPPNFLPSLSALEPCWLGMAQLLTPGRPVRKLVISCDKATAANLSTRLDVASRSSVAIECLSLKVQAGTSPEDVRYMLQQVVMRFPHLKELVLRPFSLRSKMLDVLHPLSALECLKCVLTTDMHTSEKFKTWLAKAPSSLRRVEFSRYLCGEVSWSRQLSSERKAYFWHYSCSEKRYAQPVIWESELPTMDGNQGPPARRT